MVNELDCDIAVSNFEIQSGYYVYFRINTLGKGMNPLSLQLLFFKKNGFGIK